MKTISRTMVITSYENGKKVSETIKVHKETARTGLQHPKASLIPVITIDENKLNQALIDIGSTSKLLGGD